MKRILPILLFLVCSVFAPSQDLFFEKSQFTSSEKLQTIINRSATRSVTPIALDIEQLLKRQDITFSIDGTSYSLSPINVNVRGINNFTISYRSSDTINSMVVSVFDNTIKGYLFLEHGAYSIETIEANEYILVSIDQSAFGEDVTREEYDLKNERSEEGTNENLETRMVDTHVWPVISVLVMYTNDVAQNYTAADVYTEVFDSEELSNLTFDNSGLDCKLKVVYIGQTDYDEVAHTTPANYDINLHRFTNSLDGYMDEVHVLREQYAADICVLLCSDDSSICGVAQQIQAVADSAFCMVSFNCATGNLSFPHEIGHLIGCRHYKYEDRTDTPYKYGHGYVNVTKRWRTIMAYNTFCQAVCSCSCLRIPYWSNPDILYEGDPTGDEIFYNNARVWRERAELVSFFKTTDDDIITTSSDLINANYAHVFANESLTTSGTNVTIESGNNVTFQAGISISLEPGFHASPGSYFHAYISDYDSAATHYTYTPMALPQKPVVKVENIEFSCKVTPNPIVDNSKITLIINQDYSNIGIDIVDLLGRKVVNIATEKSLSQGEHSYVIDAKSVHNGIMFVIVTSNNELLTSVKISKL